MFLIILVNIGLSQDQLTIPQLEQKLLNEILINGVGNRLLIVDFRPQKDMSPCSITITGDSSGYVSIETEYSEDRITLSVDPYTGRSTSNIWGKGSIHRFSGTVVSGQYVFIGEGEKDQRLTFAVIEQGYVYLRGNGKVLYKGKEIFSTSSSSPTTLPVRRE